jgi:hypothetical protein
LISRPLWLSWTGCVPGFFVLDAEQQPLHHLVQYRLVMPQETEGVLFLL